MIPPIDDFVPQMGNSAVERRLATLLRQQPEEDRLQFIQQLLAAGKPKCVRAALRLVKSCLKSHKSLLAILDQGLQQADASMIENWMEAVVSGLGLKRLLSALSNRVESDPESVIKARYWLPKWIPMGETTAIDAVHELDELIANRIKENSRLQTWFRSIQGPVPPENPIRP